MSKIELQLKGLSEIDSYEIGKLLDNDEIEVVGEPAQPAVGDLIEFTLSFDVVDYVKDRLQHEVLEAAMLAAKKVYFYLRDSGRPDCKVSFDFRLKFYEDKIINVLVVSDGSSIDEAMASLDPALQNETPESLQACTQFEVKKFEGKDVEIMKM